MRWLPGPTKDVRAVAFLRDGRVASGGSDRTVRIHDPTSGEVVLSFRSPTPVYALAASPDGKVLVFAGRHLVGGHRCPVARVDLDAGQVDGELAWPCELPASIWTLAYSADGQYLAAASRAMASGGMLDGGGGHWWKGGATEEGDFAVPKAYALAFAPRGHALAITHENRVSLLDAPGGPVNDAFFLQATWASAVAFAEDGQTIAVVASSFLTLARSEKFDRPRRVKTGIRSMTALAVAPDGRTLLVGGRPGTVEAYDAATGKLLRAFDFGIGAVHGLAVAPGGWSFAVAGDKGLLLCDLD